MIEGFIKACRLFSKDALVDFNSCRTEQLETVAGVPWIRVGRGDQNAPDPGRLDCFRARRRPAMRATRFQGHVKRRTVDFVASPLGVANRFDFGMRKPGPTMPTLAN